MGRDSTPPVDSRLQQFSRLPYAFHKEQQGKELQQEAKRVCTLVCALSSEGPSESPDGVGEPAAADPDLAQVVSSWPTLPEAIRRAILALVVTTQQCQES
jgi:hypothetical protein